MTRKAAAEVLARQARAIAMRAAGHSFEEIAAEVGYASRGSANKAVNRGLKDQRDIRAGDYLHTQLGRYEELVTAWWNEATTGRDGKAANIVLRALERIDKLLRLSETDAAVSQETIVISADPEQYVKDLQRIDAEREAARAALGGR